MQASPLLTNELELLEGCPELSQSTCNALTKLFSIASEIRFYELTDQAHVFYPDVNEDTDPDALPRHQEISLEFFIKPSQVPGGLDESQVTVFADAITAYHRLVAIIQERNSNFKSWEEVYATGEGFMLAAYKKLKGVDVPVREWLLKQSHVYSTSVDTSIEDADTLIVTVTVHSIIEEKFQ
jgi:hypothetical protein